jgi:hypothetical protein
LPKPLFRLIAAVCLVGSLAACSHREQVSPQERMAVEATVIGQIGIPVYRGAVTVEGYVTSGKGGQHIHAVFMSTPDSISKVATFYKERVPKSSKNSIILEGDSGSANFTFYVGRVQKQVTLSTGTRSL